MIKLLFTLIKKELLEQLRTNKILILAVIFLFVGVGSPILAKIMPELFKNISTPGITITIPTPSYKDAIDQFIKNISQIPTFIIVFLVAGAIADEKARKTLEIILTKPVERSLYLLAKFKSYFLTIGLGVVLTSIIFYAYTASLFSRFSAGSFIIIAALTLLYMFFVVSITLFGSTITKNTVVAAAVSFVGLILFGTVTNSIDKISRYSPSYILGNYKDLVERGWSPAFLPSIIATAILVLVFFLLSLLIFQKQEIER